MLLKPFMGRLADRLGYLAMIIPGMVILSVSVFSVMYVTSLALLFVIALLSGLAQALIFPASLALVARQVNVSQLGLSMGLIGALRNAGKVLGPILAGILIQHLDYQLTFQLLGGCLLFFACSFGVQQLVTKRYFTALAYRSSPD
jgi:MFS family permease